MINVLPFFEASESLLFLEDKQLLYLKQCNNWLRHRYMTPHSRYMYSIYEGPC